MKKLQQLILASMFLAIGLVLPFFTGQIPQVGKMLLPMHIPVILCGIICGWQYGMLVGFIVPLMRSFLFFMPLMFPTAFAMAFEMAAYGSIVGFLFRKEHTQGIKSLYRCMLTAMFGGRIVWGIVMMLCMGIGTGGFTFSAFLAGAFFNAIPGIVLQLVVIPVIMLALDRTRLVVFKREQE